jgi:hypothetical protein
MGARMRPLSYSIGYRRLCREKWAFFFFYGGFMAIL